MRVQTVLICVQTNISTNDHNYLEQLVNTEAWNEVLNLKYRAHHFTRRLNHSSRLNQSY